eukprot:jgi/Antlo1/52/424
MLLIIYRSISIFKENLAFSNGTANLSDPYVLSAI